MSSLKSYPSAYDELPLHVPRTREGLKNWILTEVPFKCAKHSCDFDMSYGYQLCLLCDHEKYVKEREELLGAYNYEDDEEDRELDAE